MSTRSERAQRRAARLRNQRIVFGLIGLLIIAALGYWAYTSFFAPSAALPAASTDPASWDYPDTGSLTTTPSGLQYKDLIVGSGAEAQVGNAVTVDYAGYLTDKTKFDASIDRGKPFTFALGTGGVISGWDEGVQGMKVGGKRILVIPPALGYGSSGMGGVIPPNATLVFIVELLDVK